MDWGICSFLPSLPSRQTTVSFNTMSPCHQNYERIPCSRHCRSSGYGLRNIGMRGMGQGAVVQWNEDGSHVRPGGHGPHSSHYEAARGECGAHLLFNAFWTVANCCVHQLLMKDSMHQIDLGVIVRLIMAILRKYWEDVLQWLGEEFAGLAAKKIQQRLCKVLERRTDKDGRT